MRAPARIGAVALLLAMAALAPAEEAPPVEYLDHLRHAQQHLEAKNPRRAVNEFLWAIQIHARDVQAWEGLTRTALATSDDDLALLAAHGGLGLAPDHSGLWELLGDAHTRAGRADAARAAYAKSKGPKAPADPAERDAAVAAAAKPGAPARILLRYFGRAHADSGRRDASVETGSTLPPDLLRVLVLDARGFPTPAETEWVPGFGLALADGVLRASEQACDGELGVRLRGVEDGPSATIPVRVIGPLATLDVRPDGKKVSAGERVHLRLGAVDAADHRLWLPEYRWTIVSEASTPPADLGRPNSVVAPQNGAEAHRNFIKVRSGDEAAPGSTFRVVVSDLEGKVKTEAAFEVVAGPAAGRTTLGGIDWMHSWEEAAAAARAADKPIFVEIMADW